MNDASDRTSGAEKIELHADHRQRMMNKLSENGVRFFTDVEVLEVLLFFAIPRKNTNPIAHELINACDSLAGVFDASFEELMRVPGVGERAAELIKLVPELAARYSSSKASMNDILDTPDKVWRYVRGRYVNVRDELVTLIAMDAKRRAVGMRELGEGSVGSANVSVRSIVEAAIAMRAVSVILVHNHPSEIAVPSEQDVLSTRAVKNALAAIGVELADHLILVSNDAVSMAESNLI